MTALFGAAVTVVVLAVYAEHVWYVRHFRPVEARHRAT